MKESLLKFYAKEFIQGQDLVDESKNNTLESNILQSMVIALNVRL